MDNPKICECCNEYTDDSKPVCETCITASMVADPRIAELEVKLKNQKEIKRKYVILHADDHLEVQGLQARINAAAISLEVINSANPDDTLIVEQVIDFLKVG